MAARGRCPNCERLEARLADFEGRLANIIAITSLNLSRPGRGLTRAIDKGRSVGIRPAIIRQAFAQQVAEQQRAQRTEQELLAQRESPVELDADAVERLTDLAREGREEDFRWLARSQGVPESDLDSLWRGTLARVRRSSRRLQVPA